MIGMNQIKKRLINGILIGLGVGLVFVIIILIVTNNIVKGYEEGTSEKFNQQYMTTVQTFNRDVIQGEKITDSMVQTASIPKTTLPTDLASSLTGKIAKYNIPRNVAITNNMVSDYIVGTDVRIQEINSIVMPSDLAVGEYVDIRIMMPSGIEYIVLPQKKVNDIVSTTMKMDLSEEEILTLNGAIVDSYLTDGSKLYAVKYADPTTQIKVSDSAMEDAKTYITNKIVEELVAKGAISVYPTTGTDNEEKVIDQNNLIGDLVDGVLNGQTNSDKTVTSATGEETVTIPEGDKYLLTTGTLKGDELVDMVTKYAIEYRYYVESYQKVKANYQPNSELIAYMKTNRYIIDTAKAKLSEDVRKGIETSISNFEAKNGESYDKIVSGIQNSVSTQKTLRDTVLGQQAEQTTVQ